MFLKLTDWKVVLMAMVPMGQITSIDDISLTTLRLSGCGACVMLVSYLVDPASSHMLVSKIKPCMSKYKQLYGETANGSLNQL